MPKDNQKYYFSTALPYVNSLPHIGFALELIQADVLARHYRALGKEVFFLTGTDENGLKIARAAEEAGISPDKFSKKNADAFLKLKEILNLSFDDFIRTTEKRHIKSVYNLWERCKKDVYKKKYRGLYCVGCEQFYKEEELTDKLCPEHKIAPELVEEENYFFKLSKYEKKLKKLIESDVLKIIPQSRKNEVLGFINKGLEDICISRSSGRAKNWGIPVPGDEGQIFWCWWDAVINYISALGYGEDEKRFKDWWQENQNKTHIIGKGILIFHSLYWPAALLSAGISLPDKLFVHGYVTANGQKMSKSLGNVVSPEDLAARYGVDAVRYFLLREASPFDDLDFSCDKFKKRYNADLAAGLGNLVSRVITVAVKLNLKSQILNPKQIQNSKLKTIINKTWKNYKEVIEEFKFNEALTTIWELIAFCDKYIEKERPWEESGKQKKTINNLLLAIKEIAILLEPFLPQTSEKILQQLKTKKTGPLFPRI